MTRRFILATLVILGVLWTSDPSQAGHYTFTKIVDEAVPLGQSPSINDLGQVAYFREVGDLEQIVLNTGGVETILAENDPDTAFQGDILRFLQISPVNGNGEVAHLTLRRGSHGQIVVLSAPGFGTNTNAYQPLGLGYANDNNSVVFFGNPSSNDPAGFFLVSGGEITPVVTGPQSSLRGGSLEINNLDEVVFATVQGVFLSSGGQITTIADLQAISAVLPSASSFTIDEAAVNDAGQVAFKANIAGGNVIMTGSGGPLTVIADGSGPFGNQGPPSINDDGTIVFHALLDAGGNGLFVGPDPVADRVIGTGDLLLGRSVLHVSAGKRALNNSGQIVFYARTAGVAGIFVATPVPIPEPSGILLASIGAAVLALCGRRRFRNRAHFI